MVVCPDVVVVVVVIISVVVTTTVVVGSGIGVVVTLGLVAK